MLSGDFVSAMYGKGSGRGGVRGRVTVRYGALDIAGTKSPEYHITVTPAGTEDEGT